MMYIVNYCRPSTVICLFGLASFQRMPARQMVVFGDSLSDRRRRFEAHANFRFEDIGVFPWKEVFVANDTEVSKQGLLHESNVILTEYR